MRVRDAAGWRYWVGVMGWSAVVAVVACGGAWVMLESMGIGIVEAVR